MSTYVTLYRLTEKGVQNIHDSPKRIETLRKMFKESGAEIKEFYALMGQYDIVVVAEAPNDEVILKLNLAVDAMGNVTSQTMRAFSEAEWRKMVAQIPVSLAKAA